MTTFEMAIDIACAHSYLGWSRLRPVLDDARQRGSEVSVRFLPAQIAPDAPREPEPLTAVHARLFGPQAAADTAGITRQGHIEGIDFRFDLAQFTNTHDAHLLLAAAQARGKGEPAATALFAAYFGSGAVLSDSATLRGIAESVGVDFRPTQAAHDALAVAMGSVRRRGITTLPTLVAPDGSSWTGARTRDEYATLVTSHLDREGSR